MSTNQFLKVTILNFLLVLNIQISHGQVYQNSYDKGFQIGFKEGVCYNKTSPCYVHLTPMTPLQRINESINSYSDGYNRGFQVGLDLQRIEVEFNPKISTSEYNKFYNYYPKTFKSSQYIPSVDLSLLANVLKQKQAKFDANFDLIEEQLNKLNDLNYSIFKYRDEQYFNIVSSLVNSFTNGINSKPTDYSDDNVLKYCLKELREIERLVYLRYNENIKK